MNHSVSRVCSRDMVESGDDRMEEGKARLSVQRRIVVECSSLICALNVRILLSIHCLHI